jgi:hypothetical protein
MPTTEETTGTKLNLHSFDSTETNESEEPKKIDIYTRFVQERDEWTKSIKNISSRFKKVEDMDQVQIDLYSSRQDIVEYMYRLGAIQANVRKRWMSAYKKAYDDLSMNQDYRYTDREKSKFAEEQTGELKTQLDIFQNHIDFFKESIKTIDNMVFGVKHRIEIEDFKRGVK